ncbi:MAG: response regulator [Longimicrobiales bacterium]
MQRPPLVLIVSEHEWASRSLDAVLAPHGYAVLRAYNARQALERTQAAKPDAILVDGNLTDMDAAQMVSRLRTDGGLSRAAPVVAIFAGTLNREGRLRLLESGAWDVLSLPVDADELLLRLQRYIDGKLESDRIREEALFDPSTGLYTWQGVVRRVRELGAAAERFSRPLACVVLTAAADDPEAAILAQALLEVTRRSDVIGRTGPAEFVVVAPDTAPEGAQILADRMQNAVATGLSGSTCRVGVFGVSDLREAGLDPMELLVRATMAARGRPGLTVDA